MSESDRQLPRPDPKSLTDEELERELTLTVTGHNTERLDYYERLLREKAERRAHRSKPPLD